MNSGTTITIKYFKPADLFDSCSLPDKVTPTKHISTVIATAISAASFSPIETAIPSVSPSMAPSNEMTLMRVHGNDFFAKTGRLLPSVGARPAAGLQV